MGIYIPDTSDTCLNAPTVLYVKPIPFVITTLTDLIEEELDGDALELGPLDPDGDPVAGGAREPEPGRQLEQVRQQLVVELEVAQLALAAQRRHVHLVRLQVLREPEEEEGGSD